MKENRPARMTLAAATIGAGAVLAGGALFAAIHVERGSGTVLSDPGSVTAPSTVTMTTGVTTSTSPGQGSVTPSVATPQITTTPTSATPG
ncbi:hypothetical protein FHT40_000184 [Mycolicibacterium sp. BK556]|uniref:hypothetical protein n=1 Tax=Mycobacteriaceae TaxID=1762 RepID=UPI00105EC402|nr:MULTISPECIES: hypothetical protein [Mycobacteriaceae]MBB3600551.1 hypothetical protein [Mycolicibacterium sp. BK556]MBB3630304.1 hypothetical protein [Mycolicibacterium sp. BK607]MBB3748304.1 hypothetical protein [Mycolicibacterium sp. BK634]